MKRKKTRSERGLKATAVAPANIAFIKYWGKRDEKLNLPWNDSMSMNLDKCLTTTTVFFRPGLKQDTLWLNGGKASDGELLRVTKFLGEVRSLAGSDLFAEVVSKNNFPTGEGVASSAAGFAALAAAAAAGLGLELSRRQLSVLARLGSGSACRSVVDGFSYWRKGKSHESSYAIQLADVGFWKIVDLVVVMKDGGIVNSTKGHSLATTSSFFRQRLKVVDLRIKEMRRVFLNKDFDGFGRLVEQACMEFNAIQLTSKPWFLSWSGGSVRLIHLLRRWREGGLSVYFTNDAGPHLHVLCLEKQVKSVQRRLRQVVGVKKVMINFPGKGVKVLRVSE